MDRPKPTAGPGEGVRRAARHPLAAAILGGLVVLAVAAVAVAAGWVGKEEKTIVQSPIAQPATRQSNGGLTVSDIYDRDGPGVVFIRAEIVQRTQSPFDIFPQRRRGEASGSGFVIDGDGHILTNAHLVDGATKIQAGFSGGRSADARLVGQDRSNDVALLKVDVDRKQLEPLKLGDSSRVKVGDPVVAIGNPFGLDRTVTTGIVSALQRRLQAPNGFTIEHVIQTDAAINPGNSDGPLIDADGRVIGINSQIATAGGGGSVGIGFAVPANTAKEIASELKKKGKVEHAFLGIQGASITSSLSDDLNLPINRGVLVQRATGPAARAGVKGGDTQATVGGAALLLGGDVIVQIDGKKVESMDDVIGVVDSKKPGDRVTLQLLRGSRRRAVTVTLGNRPQRLNTSSRPGQNGPQEQPLPPDLVP